MYYSKRGGRDYRKRVVTAVPVIDLQLQEFRCTPLLDN
jgi:hypothetical protein